jgi:transposase
VSVIVDVRSLGNEGLNKSQIAARLGLHRETVAKYLAMTEIPTARRRRSGSRKVDAYRDHLRQRLAKWPELSAKQLYREIRKQGYQGSERTLRRAVAAMRDKAAPVRRYRPVTTLPGEQAQVDWGHFGSITVDGQVLPLYAFVFTLSYSRWLYAEFTTSQDMATFLGCHRRALAAAGGVPSEIVYDNAKTVTVSRVGHVVQFSAGLLGLAAGYGFRPRACWVGDPESKGRVENRIHFLKQAFFYGYELSTLDVLNADGRQWCAEVGNGEVCTATGVTPQAGLADERPALRPLPVAPVEVAVVEDRHVSKTGLIHWLGNVYSVPERVQRQTVRVHDFEDRLEVFHGQERVVVLARECGKGKRVIRAEHYGRRSGPGSRGEPLQQRFEAIGPRAPEFLRALARVRHGHLRDHAEGILELVDHYGAAAVHRAMERAATFHAYGYGILKRIVEQTLQDPRALPEAPEPAAPPLADQVPAVSVQQRPLDYYATGRDR